MCLGESNGFSYRFGANLKVGMERIKTQQLAGKVSA
jgi:hypothetical protein